MLENEPAVNKTQSIEPVWKLALAEVLVQNQHTLEKKMLWKKFSEKGLREPISYCLIFFCIWATKTLCMSLANPLGYHQRYLTASFSPSMTFDCLATCLLNLLHNIFSNLQEGCAEQGSLGLIADSRAVLLCISSPFFLDCTSWIPRKQY